MLSVAVLSGGTIGLSLVLFFLLRGRPVRGNGGRKDGPVLIMASTFHSRFKPVLHAFRYPVLYVGLNLNDEPYSDAIFTTDPTRWRLLRLSADDYLTTTTTGATTTGRTTIKQKLWRVLEQHGEDTTTIGRVFFVTTPRLLGYAFNPVSFYFCYRQSSVGIETEETLSTVVLEVNNTFGEKHVYVLGQSSASSSSSVATDGICCWQFARRFHVSPFNDRLGDYRLRCRDPAVSPRRLDMHLTLLEPDGTKKLTAQVGSTTGRGGGSGFVPTTDVAASLLTLVRHHGLAAIFLTVPRILRQAYTLHYAKKLAVFLRPEPLADLPGALRRQPVSSSDLHFKEIVVSYLSRSGRAIRIVSVPTDETILIRRDGQIQTLPHATRDDDDDDKTKKEEHEDVVITVWANAFWTSLVTSPSAVHCLLTDSLSLLPAGSPIFTVGDRPEAFLDLFDRPSLGSAETLLERQRWAHRGPPAGFVLPADLAAYAHLSNRSLDESVGRRRRLVYTMTVLVSLWTTTAGNALFESIATFAGAAGRPGDAWLRVAETVGAPKS